MTDPLPPFVDNMRYEYPLSRSSMVFDLGGYHAEFALEIAQRYDCYVRIYEPVSSFYKICRENTRNFPKIWAVNQGVIGADVDEQEREIGVFGPATGKYCNASVKEKVHLCGMRKIMADVVVTVVDLVKINIEGEEYDLLDNLLDTGLVKRFGNIQIQFHHVGDQPELRRDTIRNRLIQTHREIWCSPFGDEKIPNWESWILRK